MAEGDDPATDLAQRALRVGPPLDVGPRAGRAARSGRRWPSPRRRGRRGRGRARRPRRRTRRAGSRTCPSPRTSGSPLMSGATTNEWMSSVADEAVGVGEVDEGRIVRCSRRSTTTRPSATARPNIPTPMLDLERADPRAAAVVGDAGVVGEPEDARSPRRGDRPSRRRFGAGGRPPRRRGGGWRHGRRRAASRVAPRGGEPLPRAWLGRGRSRRGPRATGRGHGRRIQPDPERAASTLVGAAPTSSVAHRRRRTAGRSTVGLRPRSAVDPRRRCRGGGPGERCLQTPSDGPAMKSNPDQ